MGNRLRELRNEKRLTLRELAEKINMSFSNIATLERGDSQLREDTAKLFADFFNVSTDYLLGLSDERNTEISKSPKDQLKGVQLAFYNQAEEITDEQAQEVLSFIEFIKNRDKK